MRNRARFWRSCVLLGSVTAMASCRTADTAAVKDAAPMPQPAPSEMPDATPATGVMTGSATGSLMPLELGEATFVDSDGKDEDFWVSKLVEHSDQAVAGLKQSTGLARRSAHAKTHGCVTGTFTIAANRPAESKVGIFKNDGSFPMWIRFSNAMPAMNPDTTPDGRGMAMKIINVPGQKLLPGHENSNAVDLPFVSGPIFPVRNVQDYFGLQDNIGSFLKSHPREALLAAEVATHVMKSPLLGTYWSMGAYKLGDRAVKFSTRPCQPSAFNIPLTLSGSFLRDAMVKQLTTKKQPACFEFGVQFQKNPETMPVEDPSVEWRESASLFSKATRPVSGDDPVSPFVKIATVTIPAQEFATKQQDDFCERLSFNPWRTLPEQRPLGNLMRARLKVYQASLKQRLLLNQTTQVTDDLTGTKADVTAN